MKATLLFVLINLSLSLFAQPPVYINFVSHNEPGDNLQTASNYALMKTKVLQLANIIDQKGAKWNLQTCGGFAKGALDNDGASSNIFRTLQQAPYADNIEIDPRSKPNFYPTIADLYHILDSLGANPTHTLGGFIWYTTDSIAQPIDWYNYETPVNATNFPVSWQCEYMWGAGSYSSSGPHVNDYNDYGIWKPNLPTDFATHNSSRNVWFIGNGCQPILSLDSLDTIDNILTPLKSFIDSIQNMQLPQNQFYCYSITINQSEFGPMLFNKVSAVCDSVNNWGTNKIQWATLTEKMDSFYVWQASTGLDSSQWKCGQTVTSIKEEYPDIFMIYPNPASENIFIKLNDTKKHTLIIYNMFGQVIYEQKIKGIENVNVSKLPSGNYIIQTDHLQRKLFIKN